MFQIFRFFERWFATYKAVSVTAKPNFKNGFQIDGTDYTPSELNLTLGAGDSGGIATGITAGTTQTQAGATALTARYNNVTTVGTAGDGVKLPTATAGLKVTVRNSAASNTLKCYPATSDSINALAVNLSVDIPALSETTFTAINDTVWYSEPTAIYLSSPTTLTGGLQIKAAASAGNTTTLITNASQAAARTYTIPDAGGDASFVMTSGNQMIAGTKSFIGGSLEAGTSGTGGSLRAYPGTASKGYIEIGASDSVGNTATTITSASQAGVRQYYIPDASTSTGTDAGYQFAMMKLGAGAPSGFAAAQGSLYVNTSNGDLYVCTTGSATAATFALVGGQS